MKEKDGKRHFEVMDDECVACNLCVEVCPAKDKKNPRHKAIDMVAQPPLRAATQISRLGTCRLTMILPPSWHSMVRMPSRRVQSTSASLVRSAASSAAPIAATVPADLQTFLNERYGISGAT